ncbi:ribosomal RNA-processing protein 8-like protein [Euroglyphus maynei]|uniref:Ribosomal RNA-processing protein 8 n=1 Tax=Euroglyphus maynei TaxID=6958 RepID=A0A1Y3BC45_EURMA|nr:ribosomal RNA-processing protein 8-like protein [Euroglyphus maynei]
MATFQSGRDRRRLQSYLANNTNANTKSLSIKNGDSDGKKRRQQSLASEIDKEGKSNAHRNRSFNLMRKADKDQRELQTQVEGFLRRHRDLEPANPTKRSRRKSDESEQRSESLADRARHTLSASMFRYLNEFLYTHSSFEARKSFDPIRFQKYHQAYERIMQQWPLKPVEYIIDRLKQQIPAHRMDRIVMADIGCGSQPRIAQAFPRCTVYSYDLYSSSDNPAITSADMCRLPLDCDQCDYLIYSLSLMPKNLDNVFCECNRILKLSTGYAMIVEVASRFADYGKKTSSTEQVENKFAADFENFAQDLRQHYGLRVIEYNLLPPNDYFVHFILKKIQTTSPTGPRPPMIQLKPCVYRHREPKQKINK